MGQAKQRGTFKERKDRAVVRNKQLEAQLLPLVVKNPQSPTAKLYRERGLQAVATRLVAAQLLAR